MQASDNLALKIAEERAKNTSLMASPEREILDTVAEYSLQFNAEQLEVLHGIFLRIILNKRVPLRERDNVQQFINFVKTNKRYHDTMFFLTDAIDAMHYKKAVDNVQAQIIRTNQGH